MSRRLTQPQIMIFIVFLIGLFFLAIRLLPRLPTPPISTDAAVTPVGTPAGTPPGTPLIQSSLQQTALAPATPLPVATLDPTSAGLCRDQTRSFISQLDPLVSAWVSARKTAGRAPSEQLAGQVDNLEALRQQTQALAVPECAAPAYLSLLDSMDHAVEAYRGFVNELPDDAIQRELQQSNQAFSRYVAEIDQLR